MVLVILGCCGGLSAKVTRRQREEEGRLPSFWELIVLSHLLSISLPLGLLGLCSFATATRPEDTASQHQMQGCILHRMGEPGHSSVLGPKTPMAAPMPLVMLGGCSFVVISLLAFY